MNGWNEKSNEFLTRLHISIVEAADAHNEAAQNYSKWTKWFGLPTTIFCAITTSASFVIASDSDVSTLSTVLLTSTSVVATSLSAANTFLGYEKKSRLHSSTSKAYDSLSFKTATLLSVRNKDRRVPYPIFMEELRGIVENIRKTALVLPKQKELVVEDISPEVRVRIRALTPPPRSYNLNTFMPRSVGRYEDLSVNTIK